MSEQVTIEDLIPEEEPSDGWTPNPQEPYQLFPPPTEHEYEALKASIREHGVSQAVEVDEEGDILDGHQRFRICGELGIPCPIKVVTHLKTEEQKRDYARQINCGKRSVSMATKKRLAEEMLLENEKRSNPDIAVVVGISKETVRAIRKSLEESGKICRVGDEIEETPEQEEEEEPKFPYLDGDQWKHYHKAEAYDYLGRMDDDQHRILRELLGNGNRSPKEVLPMLERAAGFVTHDRVRMKELWDSGDSRRRGLVRSKLAGTAPVRSPQIPLVMEAVNALRESIQRDPAGVANHRLNSSMEALSDAVREIDDQQEVW